MDEIKSDFIPEIWSQQMVDTFKEAITINMIPKRSYGSRLLRAAAKGEDWTKIEKTEEDPHERFTNDAADALAYSLDRDILKRISDGFGE
jgi:hypothetical protein